MTSKSDFYAPQEEREHDQQQYQQGGAVFKEQQDYEILEAGLVHNAVNSGVGGTSTTAAGGWGSTADMERQLRLGELSREEMKQSGVIRNIL